ncbi:MAG: aminopeptidase P family N-terminal domain-containing protein, partial [Oscillospiraceae bacterium]|nr:aminopeptidase P family N-terminal domain-containing protein [Oscillospiraceae bacterium]
MDIYEKIRGKLGELDALIVLSPVNRRYVTGFTSSDGVLVITRTDAWLIVDSRYYEAACKHAGSVTLHPHSI